jgi:hypothetical protein
MPEYRETPGPWMPVTVSLVIEWYDGSPLLFEAKVSETDVIAMMICAEQAGNHKVEYFAWEMDRTRPIIEDFLADRIDLRDLLLSEKVEHYEIATLPADDPEAPLDVVARKVSRVLGEDVLPDPGVFWSAYMGHAYTPERPSEV